MVVIVDYGLGNLRSVAGAVRRIGFEPVVSSNPADLEMADKLILPGVGAFGDGMRRLRALGLVDPLTRLVLEEAKPILGICLGAQLFAAEGFEFGHHQGLGWLDASVVRLEKNDETLEVPHVGWDDLIQARPSVLLQDVPPDALFYYVHSFHVRCRDEGMIVGTCEYGTTFTAVFQCRNVYGTQFHPEKSQRHGLQLLRNFLEKG